MKNTNPFSLQNLNVMKLSVQSLLHKIASATSRIATKFGIANYKRELTDLNPFSSRLLQRLSLTYQKRTANSQTTWTITPAIHSTASKHQALTFHEFSSNIENYQAINEARWNDELVKEILEIKS